MTGIRTMVLTGGLAFTLLPGLAAAQNQASLSPDAGRSEASTATLRPRPIQPQTFRSPEDGFAAMAAAAHDHDQQRLLRILGEAARPLIRSGDPVADRAAQDRFAAAYAEKAEILRPDANIAVLQVGDDGWPLPMPMIRRDGVWRFDARRGVQEMVNRRIGRNELDTIEVLRAIVVAQEEFARTEGRQGAFRSYARRFFSTPGMHDGLYWPAMEGHRESPLGPLVAVASSGGYGSGRGADDRPRPFRGYFFRILEVQGPTAPGGAMNYVVNGRMIGGFGIIAYPAEYGVSGIQTFLVSHAGIVYQRNLGPATARIARNITAFDPGPGWQLLEE